MSCREFGLLKRSEETNAHGEQTLFSRSASGLAVEKNTACGMEYQTEYSLDPEFGSQLGYTSR